MLERHAAAEHLRRIVNAQLSWYRNLAGRDLDLALTPGLDCTVEI